MRRKPLQKLNAKHEIFIKEMIEHGDQAKAYQKAFPETAGKSAINGRSRLMNEPLIVERIMNALREIQNDIKDIKVTEAKEKLQNYIGIRDVLGDIITGKRKFEKLFKVGDAVEPFTTGAGPSAVVRALDINIKLLKMVPDEISNQVRTVFLIDEASGQITEVK